MAAGVFPAGVLPAGDFPATGRLVMTAPAARGEVCVRVGVLSVLVLGVEVTFDRDGVVMSQSLNDQNDVKHVFSVRVSPQICLCRGFESALQTAYGLLVLRINALLQIHQIRHERRAGKNDVTQPFTRRCL